MDMYITWSRFSRHGARRKDKNETRLDMQGVGPIEMGEFMAREIISLHSFIQRYAQQQKKVNAILSSKAY